MPALTDEQRLFFETNGYLVIPNALSSQELTAAQDAADRAYALWKSDTSRLGIRQPLFEQVQAPIEYDDLFLDMMEHPSTFPLIREVLGNDVSMIDNDYFITHPGSPSNAGWHHDVGMAGVYHPRSVMMVKLFFLLEDVAENGGPTLFLPGSHRYPNGFPLPKGEPPSAMPCHTKMAFPAGTAYFFNGRTYHASAPNESQTPRRVLIYNYGHFWMKIWQGYEPSERLKVEAKTAVRRQLLGMGPAYGPYAS